MSKKDHTPPSASRDGKKNWLDAFESPRVTARQAMAIAGLACAVALAEGIAIAALAPLKEARPYFVEVENATGKVVAAPDRWATEFKVEERHIRYFMNQWVMNFLTIDTRTREYLLPASYGYLKGEAVKKWAKFVEEEDKTIKRIYERPDLRREIQVQNIAFVGDGVAIVRFRVNETGWPAFKSKQMTIFYSVIPPSADEKVISNPIGFYITDFTINDELV